MNLECSSRGDKRFSAFSARVTVNGVERSIEEHYQLSKRFGDFIPKSWKDAKGKKPTHFVVGDRSFDVKYLTSWYELLWIKYFVCNLELLEYARKFDTYSDMFAKAGSNSQHIVIYGCAKYGLRFMLDRNAEFIELLK